MCFDFEKKHEFLTGSHGKDTWVIMYDSDYKSNKYYYGMYSALADLETCEKSLNSASWDLLASGGLPSFVEHLDENGEWIRNYVGYDNADFERLIYLRDFKGIVENYVEVSEEFRLFHNLYYDSVNNRYLDFDDCGDFIEVIKITNNKKVEIRRKYLMEYLSAKCKNLILYWDVTLFHENQKEFHIHPYIKNEELICIFNKNHPKIFDDSYCSVFYGKKIIFQEKIQSDPKKHESFCIAGNDENPHFYSCDNSKLADNFGHNPNNPYYLTPVFFKKEVMQKYYESDKYEVQDGSLRCQGLWSIHIDNGLPNHVSVFLGDLGRDMPYKEQQYWKLFNVPPESLKISEGSFRRSFLGEFADSSSPEFRFKSEFEQLNNKWKEHFGWNLFLPLSQEDQHFFENIRTLIADSQREFDNVIFALAKSTIDSLNVKDMRTFLGKDCNDESKSLRLFEEILIKLHVLNALDKVNFLRNIQNLRSSSSAHRKGKQFEKLKSQTVLLQNKQYQNYVESVLNTFAELCKELINHLSSET